MSKWISNKEYLKRSEELLRRIQQDVKPFDDVRIQAKADRKKKAASNLVYFAQTYLPHHFDSPVESGHEDIAKALKEEWNKVIQVRGFRGAGKSTWVIVAYALQSILFKKTRYLPVISDTDDQSVMQILSIKTELESNPRIIADFDEQRGLEWAEDSFVTKNGVKVEASSWRSFKRGRKYLQHRAKIIMCDDLESLESVKNKRNVDKREDALMGDILNALDLKAEWQLIVVTNKLNREDVDHRLLENKAVHSVSISAEQENGRAMHPKSFPKKVLNTIKATIGHVKYAREYLLKIISSEQDDFQEEWFIKISKPEFRYKYVVLVNDPSVGSTEGHDTKPWLVMGLTMDERHVDVMHAWIRRTTIDQMCRTGFALFEQFQPHKVVVEGNGFQVLLRDKFQSMAKEMNKGFGFVSSVQMIQNNTNKNTRIMRLQSGIENGFFRFVSGSDMDRLITQFLNFDSSVTNNTDDGPDAMEMGNRALRRLNGEIQTTNVEVFY